MFGRDNNTVTSRTSAFVPRFLSQVAENAGMSGLSFGQAFPVALSPVVGNILQSTE
jgi:hypothetical protein